MYMLTFYSVVVLWIFLQVFAGFVLFYYFTTTSSVF